MNKIKMDPTTTPGHMLIAEERMEQVTKHGRILVIDAKWTNKELLRASMFCMTLNEATWPVLMGEELRDKIKSKPYVERLAIAGAFIAAEMDRKRNIQPPFYTLR